jgi:prevent-host-death family protein
MKKASITEAKNGLSALVDLVRHGETIMIVDRGRPVARLEPAVGRGLADDEGRVARLERIGAIRRPAGATPTRLIARKPPRARSSALQALLDERRTAR